MGDRMIFVALGTQKFQFNRLLKAIDFMVKDRQIKDKVFAQIGNSTYRPKSFEYARFLTINEYNQYIKECDIIITHAGVGTILEGKKFKKVVIVVPRLSKYGEHVDDHQLEIAEDFAKKKLVLMCRNLKELPLLIKESKNSQLVDYVPNNKSFILKLKKAIENL
ncbi:PssE/Cps14G family polysaccharide biosynthesis glycosyltransferase [Limosilactobacillus reuteri]|uniref:Glycosyl transferase n=1 Tax=Limosilactobacillus reuteri TaxID=1598 RepID=A0AAX2SSQ9_LIMRT|nr:PssE/Cps14G family polysaccharide biosynthesis glycosyltransferase [Limosilactobacillus reuteri]RMX25845.1 glycosyl transferase [Limosilactobacillus reuteri]TGB09753.1 glycosyl transferase [Limosilactobacillus reuteri]